MFIKKVSWDWVALTASGSSVPPDGLQRGLMRGFRLAGGLPLKLRLVMLEEIVDVAERADLLDLVVLMKRNAEFPLKTIFPA